MLVATQLKLGVNENDLGTRLPLVSGRFINQSLDARAQRWIFFIFDNAFQNRL